MVALIVLGDFMELIKEFIVRRDGEGDKRKLPIKERRSLCLSLKELFSGNRLGLRLEKEFRVFHNISKDYSKNGDFNINGKIYELKTCTEENSLLLKNIRFYQNVDWYIIIFSYNDELREAHIPYDTMLKLSKTYTSTLNNSNGYQDKYLDITISKDLYWAKSCKDKNINTEDFYLLMRDFLSRNVFYTHEQTINIPFKEISPILKEFEPSEDRKLFTIEFQKYLIEKSKEKHND